MRKAKLDQWPFIVERRNKVIFSTVLIGGGILLFCAAVLFWVMRPIRLLTEYVRAVAGGKRVPLPELGSGLEVNTLGTALEGMRDELEGRDYATDFVQTVTHELKSPLAAIRGAAELLQEPGMAAEDRTRFLESLRRESDRAERLLRQLLRLSEVERRRELRDVREVAVEEVVRAAMDEVKGGAERRRVTLELTLNKDARLRAEPMLLRRALVNVLENAIDFSPPGGPVRVEVETEGAEVMIEVRDAGPGFPEYALKRVFERFYSLKQEQAGVKGTGLGLCLVREAMLLHGGTVEVENAEPTGAVVTLRLPVGG